MKYFWQRERTLIVFVSALMVCGNAWAFWRDVWPIFAVSLMMGALPGIVLIVGRK